MNDKQRAQAAPAALALLRQATAGRHEEIEFLVRFDEQAGLDRAVLLLKVFDAFLREWEPRVANVLPRHLCDWFERTRRGDYAREDLRVLRVQPIEDGTGAHIDLASTAAVLGSLYVIEGSALGGRVIARQLEERFGITAGSGASFFAARGPETGRMWREFCELLEGELTEDEQGLQQACQAANDTFAALADMFRAAS